MKSNSAGLLFSLFVLFSLVSCNSKTEIPSESIRILTYQSLASKGALLDSSQLRFESQSNCKLHVDTVPGASQIHSRLNDRRVDYDFVFGIDALQFSKSMSFFDLSPTPLNLAADKPFKLDPKIPPQPAGFYPVEYGALTLIYRISEMKRLNLDPPKKFHDLIQPRYHKQFIVQDPRLSSPGLYFFLSVPKTDILALAKQWRVLAQSWEPSYQLFLNREAPMVWSYLSSMAYHENKGEGSEFGFVNFEEGLPIQIEGMARVSKNVRSRCENEWMSFVYSPYFQSLIPEKQYMFPMVQGTPLPASFLPISKVTSWSKNQFSVAQANDILKNFAGWIQ